MTSVIDPNIRLGGYRLISRLGKGGMGTVYLAEDESSCERVALKVLHEHLTRDAHSVERFFAEVEAVSRIRHPNVVRITDFVAAPQAYYAMEFLEGRTLADELEQLQFLPLRRAVWLTMQICQALYAAHQKGIVHRDLKPENIFIVRPDQGGRESIKVLDFGVAKLEHQLFELTPPNALIGTPTYMAPEQAVDGDVDARSDIYALGVMLYEMVCGRPPFSGNMASVIRSHLEDSPMPPRFQAGPGHSVPKQLDRLILRCMAKSKHHRPDDMQQMSDELRAIAPQLRCNGTEIDPQLTAARQGTPRRRRHTTVRTTVRQEPGHSS